MTKTSSRFLITTLNAFRFHPAEKLTMLESLELDFCANHDENEAPLSQDDLNTTSSRNSTTLSAATDDVALLLTISNLSYILQSCCRLKTLTFKLPCVETMDRVTQVSSAEASCCLTLPSTLQKLTLCGISNNENEHDKKSATNFNISLLGELLLSGIPSSLRRLTLQDMVLTPNDDGSCWFVRRDSRVLAQNESLELLQIHQCRCSIDLNLMLNHFLVASQALECIECDFSTREARTTGYSITNGPGVVPQQFASIRLIQCKLSDVNVASICQHQRCLKTLDLRGNDLSIAACRSIAVLLSDEHSTLEKLILEQTGLDHEKLEILCRDGLRHNRSLRKLNLRDNTGLSDCRVLKVAFILQHLDISDNPQLGDNGIASLQTMISHPNSRLRRLDLENCGLTKQSMGALFGYGDSSSSLLTLEHLNLSCNNLARMRDWSCARLPQLQTLQLSSCRLSDTDLVQCIAFRQQQQQHQKLNSSHIRNIDLQHNSIVQATTIAKLLLSHPQLQTLDIQFNPFSHNKNEGGNMALIVDVVRHHHYNLAQLHLTHPYSRRRVCNQRDDLTSSSSATTIGEQEQLIHWMKLNQAGRDAILRNDNNGQRDWTEQLQYAESIYGINSLFYFLRESPHKIAGVRSAT